MAAPWFLLVSNALKILADATDVVSRTRARKSAPGGASVVDALQDRVAALESVQQTDAEALEQVSEQLHALTDASAALAARMRALPLVAIVAVLVATVALVICVAR